MYNFFSGCCFWAKDNKAMNRIIHTVEMLALTHKNPLFLAGIITSAHLYSFCSKAKIFSKLHIIYRGQSTAPKAPVMSTPDRWQWDTHMANTTTDCKNCILIKPVCLPWTTHLHRKWPPLVKKDDHSLFCIYVQFDDGFI